MNEKNLLICDKEIRYADGLGENILQRNELALRVYACSNIDSVMQFRKEKEIHILIIDEIFSEKEREKIGAQQIFVLTKERCKDLRENEKEIYKFQSADQILAEIFETYYEKTNNNILRMVNKSKQRLLAVYSPIHRIGKTTFAIALGKEFAKREKTLYLNFEAYADVEGRFVCAEGRNLGDLLYFMRQEETNVALRLSTMIIKMEELDYIPPLLMSRDLKEITFEEWSRFLNAILHETSYETVILDLSECVQGLIELLRLCNKIYMPVLEDPISKRKLNQYEEELRKMKLEEIEEKTYKFSVVEDMKTYARKLVREEM